ncbi:class I SAM-dependent methyltransferase [Spiribacter vilamensis]|uniref:Class I SAM-dependent methyltransferase n=1 Tax=Spiribacter vilamensis TaxID=531306 RepID=A0A4Q8CYU2_9GAMM|nr:class I SAM-dependent methyltransferase [Spiribacter vilamensis]RZU98070.1 hypothetical protein EV698_0306 [Spiribacter vilamensis]TVO61028.1 class I SAM-dependent methyltransferase [Spiribacter vilamensis]
MPERFAAQWLTLREPVDHTARADDLSLTLAGLLPGDRRVHVADLGAGAGSNLRYLAPRLPQPQQWALIDHDTDLLDRAVATAPGDRWASDTRIHAYAHPADLNDFPDCLPGTPDLLTASALLDLVTGEWMQRVVDTCARRCIPALFALSVDGRMSLAPAVTGDELIETAILAHQRGTKDMGPALGPDATDVAARMFVERGITVERRWSDWQLGPEEASLQKLLIEGWHEAARAQRPDAAETIDTWLNDRLRLLDQSRILVGHQDLLAIPCRD